MMTQIFIFMFILHKYLYKCNIQMRIRDGPFDFSWGGGRKSEKKYRACLEWKKKKSNITNTSKKKYRAQKNSKLAILYIERKIQFPLVFFC